MVSHSFNKMDAKTALTISILISIKLGIYILLIIVACAYAIPLCVIHRFHSSINIMTTHVCFTFIGSAMFWIIVYNLHLNSGVESNLISQERCSILSSIETILNCSVVYSLCSVSINRLFCIKYPNKNILKSQRWALISIGITWLVSLSLSMPLIVSSNKEVGE